MTRPGIEPQSPGPLEEVLPTMLMGYHHHHHHIALSARLFLTLYRHPSLSSIAFGRSSGLHPVSVQSCCMYIRAGHPAFARPCERVHRSTSLMSSSSLLQQCPTCMVHLILIAFVISGWWLFWGWGLSPRLDQYCLQHSRVIAVKFFSIHFVSVHVVHP